MAVIDVPSVSPWRSSADSSRPWQPKQGRRTLADLSPMVHCSIIGTCLTLAELRRLVRKLVSGSIESLSDHDVHTKAVRLASVQGVPSKLLNKALDEKHQAIIRRFNKAASEADIKAFWRAALQQGQIEGAYWAVVTHPLSSEAFFMKVFGEVHMLSHLVGSSNRVDIRRLIELEQENERLRRELDQAIAVMRTGLSRRDKQINELQLALASLADDRLAGDSSSDLAVELSTLRTTLTEMRRRMETATSRNERLKESLQHERRCTQESETKLEAALQGNEQLEKELRALENCMQRAVGQADLAQVSLDRSTILYVGGKSGSIQQLKAVVEAFNGVFLHHDGGQMQNMALLAGLISRSVCVFFPVDFVSHQAMFAIKRQCGLHQIPFIALQRSGAASLARGIEQFASSHPRPGTLSAVRPGVDA